MYVYFIFWLVNKTGALYINFLSLGIIISGPYAPSIILMPVTHNDITLV